MRDSILSNSSVMDRQMNNRPIDQQTNGWMDKVSNRVACQRLKREIIIKENLGLLCRKKVQRLNDGNDFVQRVRLIVIVRLTVRLAVPPSK